MAPPLVRDTPVDKRVPGTINDADLWTERIEQQPKNNQERKKREAGIDELHRIPPHAVYQLRKRWQKESTG